MPKSSKWQSQKARTDPDVDVYYGIAPMFHLHAVVLMKCFIPCFLYFRLKLVLAADRYIMAMNILWYISIIGDYVMPSL